MCYLTTSGEVYCSLERLDLLIFHPISANSAEQIIVGGGTAGAALGTRLSLDLPSAKILILEAGPAALDEPKINVPGLRGSILGTNYDWNFTTVPQPGLGGRQISVNRGKVLGGSSAMNYLCYDRAAAAEYQAWGELGSPGWTWERMFDAMTKSENFTGEDKDVRGRSGPIRNTYNRVVYDVLNTWQPTATQLDIPINEKGNMGGNPIGFMFQGTNVDSKKYTRSYSANSYLPLAGSNLMVKTGTQVANIELESCGQKFRATGVTLQDGTTIAARREVILSAGSIQSPGLLEVSGIGQASVLKNAGIKQLVNLPGVGENYQDHIRIANTYRLKDGIDSFDDLIFQAGGQNATGELQKWNEGKVSLYDYTTAAYGFLKWDQTTDGSDAVMALALGDTLEKGSNVVDKMKAKFLKNPSVPDLEFIFEANYVGAFGYTGGNFITLIATVMHPLSRGNVHIDPTNPHGKPVIDPKYFSNEDDIRGIIEGAKFSRKIANTKPMAETWVTETEPGQNVQTDDQWRDFARKAVNSFYHPVGTCALLPKKDGGVVDANLRVYGTENLRVVDNSIIPVIPSAHIQTAAYGIAEVAAGLIVASA